MPTKSEWVEPEEFLTHKGVTIVHAYKDGEADERMTFWYAVKYEGEPDGVEFDIRDLPNPNNVAVGEAFFIQAKATNGKDYAQLGRDILDVHRQFLIDAIDNGTITATSVAGKVFVNAN